MKHNAKTGRWRKASVADPIFGVAALNEVGKKASARLKPFRPIREHKNLRVRDTQMYHDMMEYVLGEHDS